MCSIVARRTEIVFKEMAGTDPKAATLWRSIVLMNKFWASLDSSSISDNIGSSEQRMRALLTHPATRAPTGSRSGWRWGHRWWRTRWWTPRLLDKYGLISLEWKRMLLTFLCGYFIPKKCQARPSSSGVQAFGRGHTFVYNKHGTRLHGHDVFHFHGGG